jgi:hypothetical protein
VHLWDGVYEFSLNSKINQSLTEGKRINASRLMRKSGGIERALNFVQAPVHWVKRRLILGALSMCECVGDTQPCLGGQCHGESPCIQQTSWRNAASQLCRDRIRPHINRRTRKVLGMNTAVKLRAGDVTSTQLTRKIPCQKAYQIASYPV